MDTGPLDRECGTLHCRLPGAHTLAHSCSCRLASRVNIIRAGPSLCQRSRPGSHARRPSQDSHAVHPLHGLMTFFHWHTIFCRNRSVGISLTTAWRLNFAKSPPDDSGPYADQTALTLTCMLTSCSTGRLGAEVTRKAMQGSIMRELPMLTSQNIQPANDPSPACGCTHSTYRILWRSAQIPNLAATSCAVKPPSR